jgi:hypothetical protein
MRVLVKSAIYINTYFLYLCDLDWVEVFDYKHKNMVIFVWFVIVMKQVYAGLRRLNYIFPLRLWLSKSFGSGADSGNSLGTTCYHRFYVKKDIFHVFNERKST